MSTLRLGVLVSGRGSNLQAILDAVAARSLPARVSVVVSNRAGAFALSRASERGVLAVAHERTAYPSRAAQERAIADELVRHGVDLVVLAGYDRVVGPPILQRFPLRVINIHPSLLPAFGGGLHAQADALAHGVKVSGCTVHFVTDQVDGGPIILQAAVPVMEDDTADSLAARILEEEHRILPAAIDLYARGRLAVEGRRVRILPQRAEVDRQT